MYNLLIVDDELHVVKGLIADLDVEKLNLAAVHSAYNIRQAQEILKSVPIDMMLCDIEMPQGSGLDLLKWTNEHYPDLVTVFLTSHADFKYAKQALQLGSFDYLLKPVPDEELEQVLLKAQERITQTSKANRLEKLWNSHHSVVIEQFWQDLIQEKIPSNPEAIHKILQERDLTTIPEDMLILPILISVRRWNKSLSVRDEKIMEYALKNSAEELIIEQNQGGQILTIDKGDLLIILPIAHGQDEVDMAKMFFHKCEQYVEKCHKYFLCDISGYMGSLVPISGLVHVLNQLRRFESNNVAFDNKAFLLTGTTSFPDTSVPMPEMSVWSTLLKSGKKEKLLQVITDYLNERVANMEVNSRLLSQLHQNFLQMVYFTLQAEGKQAHHLFCDAESMELSRHATRSVTDLMTWIGHTLGIMLGKEEIPLQSSSIVMAVKQYIAAHLSQSDLSREEIAQHAFLNPDYLARLFKKETGISVMEYLLQERIKLAKELLIHSDMTIGNVATSVGYSYFSHFSKMFKKQTGYTPNEYKLQYREE